MPRLHPYHYVVAGSPAPSIAFASANEALRFKYGMDAYFYGEELPPGQQLLIATQANDLSGVANALFRHHGACNATQLISANEFTQAFLNVLRPNYETVKSFATQIPRGTLAFPRDDDRGVDTQAVNDMFDGAYHYVSQFPGPKKWARAQRQIAGRLTQYVGLTNELELPDAREGINVPMGLSLADCAFALWTGGKRDSNTATTLPARAEIVLQTLAQNTGWKPDIEGILTRDSSREQIGLLDAVFRLTASRLNDRLGQSQTAVKARRNLGSPQTANWWSERSDGFYYKNLLR
jgi:hypothetical protein